MSTPNTAVWPKPILIDLPNELVGPRAIIRPYRPGDGAALWDAVEESREHIEPWLPWGPSHKSPVDSEAFARRAYSRWLSREDMGWTVWDRVDRRFLGGIGLHPVSWDVPSFEIGYWLRNSAEGHGYMTESVQLMTALAFDTLKASRVFIRVAAANHRSAAIPKRLGFLHEGRLRNFARDTRGELRDQDIYAMTPVDYAAASWRVHL